MEKLVGDRDVALMTQIPHPYPPGDAREWIERTGSLIEQGRLEQFAITLAETNELVG